MGMGKRLLVEAIGVFVNFVKLKSRGNPAPLKLIV